jgi:hypothetical protein
MHLAVRSMWLLGGLLVALGMCGTGGGLFLARRGGLPRGMAVMQMIGALFYLVPGVLYIVFAIYVKQRQFWAVIAGLVLAAAQFLFLLVGFVATLVMYFLPDSDLPRPFLVVIGVMGLFTLALAQLVYHLARSFQAIQLPPYGKDERGFEPVGVHPVLVQPVPENQPIVTGTTRPGDSDAASPPR